MLKIFESGKTIDYMVTENGEVYSKNKITNKLVQKTPTLNKKRGYYYVRTRQRNWALHRIVAETYIDNPNNYPAVDHKDGNKLNNKVTNLEWVTYKENSSRAKKLGLTNYISKGTYKRYTQDQYNRVEALIKKGMSYSKAGKTENMPYSTVAHFMRGSRGVRYEN